MEEEYVCMLSCVIMKSQQLSLADLVIIDTFNRYTDDQIWRIESWKAEDPYTHKPQYYVRGAFFLDRYPFQ